MDCGENKKMVRVLMEGRCVAPLTLDDDDCYDGNSVRTLSYHKLPHTRMRLSVLKLDGSLFDVYIQRNGTVAELRQAIEEVFTLPPTEVQGQISWTHVWGHFCLCYNGQKLVNDKTHIQDFRIKDGDQLQFSRHMSIDYLHSKRRSKTQSADGQQFSRLSVGSYTCEEEYTVLAKKNNLENQDKRSSSGYDAHKKKKHSLADKDSLGNQDDSHKHNQHEDQEEISVPEYKLAHFLRGWFPYSKLRGVSRKTTEGKSHPSRFAMSCLGPPRMIQL